MRNYDGSKRNTKDRTNMGQANHGERRDLYTTSKDTRDYYFFYKMDGDKAVKLGKAKSPLELEQKYIGG